MGTNATGVGGFVTLLVGSVLLDLVVTKSFNLSLTICQLWFPSAILFSLFPLAEENEWTDRGVQRCIEGKSRKSRWHGYWLSGDPGDWVVVKIRMSKCQE